MQRPGITPPGSHKNHDKRVMRCVRVHSANTGRCLNMQLTNYDPTSAVGGDGGGVGGVGNRAAAPSPSPSASPSPSPSPSPTNRKGGGGRKGKGAAATSVPGLVVRYRGPVSSALRLTSVDSMLLLSLPSITFRASLTRQHKKQHTLNIHYSDSVAGRCV
jgi:hypothetical protein